jgi:hypothetical protein
VQTSVIAFTGALLAILAFAVWTIGQNVIDLGVWSLAQQCLCSSLFGGLYLVGGFVAVAGIASLLRRAQ